MSKLEAVLNQVVKENFPDNFRFRPKQKEAILAICRLYFSKETKNVILNAPTGSGKSIIAMLIGLVLQKYRKSGYIITSNLDLQSQYEKDLLHLNLGWGSIKGMDNYQCSVNGKNFRLGECRSRGWNIEKAQTLPCYSTCGYYANRAKAIESPVSVLNYAYWLLQMNYVNRLSDKPDYLLPFGSRDFVVFDEAHKVDDIVQNHFQVLLTPKFFQDFEALCKELYGSGFINNRPNYNWMREQWDNLVRTDKSDELIVMLENILKVTKEIEAIKEDIEGYLNAEFPLKVDDKWFEENEKTSIPKDWSRWLNQLNKLRETNCKIEDYIEIAIEDPDTIVKNMPSDASQITFCILKDQLLIKSKLHNHSKFSVFMSATFGDAETWARLTGTEDYKIINLGSNWQFQDSPIYFMKGPKLNFREREHNWPYAIEMFDKIIDEHPDERGIVHTASYMFAKRLQEDSKHRDRFLVYGDTAEKIQMLEELDAQPRGILVGPSLIEGLDLKDDLCRFQLFLKVPYRQLMDQYTQSKLKYDPEWYNWKTLINFVQGIGRGIRHSDDWSVTYLLDGCFSGFLVQNEKKIPKWIKKRIKRKN